MKQRGWADLFFFSNESYWDFAHDQDQDAAIDIAETQIELASGDVGRLRRQVAQLERELADQQIGMRVLVQALVANGILSEAALAEAVDAAEAARAKHAAERKPAPVRAVAEDPLAACDRCKTAVPMSQTMSTDDGTFCPACFSMNQMLL